MSKMAQVLIVIDMQNELSGCYNFEELIDDINNRIDDYRQDKLPIIFIQHNDSDLIKGSEEWNFVSELDKRDSDLVVEKTHANSFYHTELNELLRENGLKTIEICGAQTEYCCDTTIKMAHGLGYKILMQPDMTTTMDNDYLSAKNTIDFYEDIWNKRFVSFI
ncbi:isochorismatase hydrolase [Companilactobacillus tucceti DSM 20183]|uniref:Isochorismatase hydrolase n=1 Tax=Companilactobacillus tucceti DSM 20183 TaxID=1423811 RepID=A0A0R1J0S5_9LACO|nr:cysteine hydrolase family protein [Companilactobacillus tucceti]KRK64812.1 isochorismatase hydrolase [Companilactobacillus tucceti DSM 20183]